MPFYDAFFLADYAMLMPPCRFLTRWYLLLLALLRFFDAFFIFAPLVPLLIEFYYADAAALY